MRTILIAILLMSATVTVIGALSKRVVTHPTFTPINWRS